MTSVSAIDTLLKRLFAVVSSKNGIQSNINMLVDIESKSKIKEASTLEQTTSHR